MFCAARPVVQATQLPDDGPDFMEITTVPQGICFSRNYANSNLRMWTNEPDQFNAGECVRQVLKLLLPLP